MRETSQPNNQSSDDYKGIIDAIRYLEIESRNLGFNDIALSLKEILRELEDNNTESETILSLESNSTPYPL